MTDHRSCEEAHREVERLRSLIGEVIDDFVICGAPGGTDVCQACEREWSHHQAAHEPWCPIGRLAAALSDQGRD